MSEKSTYRIRTTVGRNGNDMNAEQCVTVQLKQSYDILEIMSLKIDQSNAYKYYESDYGVVVGRVIANGGFGIPNAKVSIFIEVDESDSTQSKLLYSFIDTDDTDNDNVVYNLLPDSVDSACHQTVGTFPNKRLVLDNKDEIEIFGKYWKYTTITNQSGDYMLFGVPTGNQILHVDVDLSDCGVLSQRPRDMIAQGSDANLFESPNKFRKSKDLKSLAQIKTQNQGLYVYPYWGETNENDGQTIAVTRCDIDIQYKFEPTCIFIGSMITDKGSNALGKNCTGDEKMGKMSDLATGKGKIEMIRKTLDNRVEEYPIMGNELIDGDGVWCYQIPMNLDYVTTDEFGNMVPTDDPNKGIPTRTRVRFRFTMDESPDDATARKRCRYLVPNNPRMDDMNPVFKETHEEDYEFGSATREESYRDLLWNKVYTVKNYIPKLQKNRNETNRKHTGIKIINHFGDNNPMPYNSITIKLGFAHRLICIIVKMIIYIIMTLNYILGVIMLPFCTICKILQGLGKIPLVGFVFKALAVPFCAIVFSCIKLDSSFCDDGINKKTYYPGCWGCQKDETERRHNKEQAGLTNPEDITIAEFPGYGSQSTLFTCIENSLAQDNEATSFNFVNDWVNGVLYAPLWHRKIRAKKKFLFGLFSRPAKDEWCDANGNFGLMLFQTCAVRRTSPTTSTPTKSPLDGSNVGVFTVINPDTNAGECGKNGNKCHETKATVSVSGGLILNKKTLLGETVYYYKSVEYNPVEDDVTLLFATDIVLLGSLNDCDLDGIPQFYTSLEPTSFNQPTDILFTDTQIAINDDGESVILDYSTFTEATGADWGNLNSTDECGKMGKDDDGGLFYSIGCNAIEMKPKTILNMARICEFGVTLDAVKHIADLSKLEGSDDDSAFDKLIPDGFVSWDESFNPNERSMFATLNGNRLRTRLNKTNGLPEYDFRHYYIDNFDGGMSDIMEKDLMGCDGITYQNNYKLERYCPDYYLFRMGEKPYFYNTNSGLDTGHRLPRFENSFYFYFGLKSGKTAIEKFNSQFFAPCETISGDELKIGIYTEPNDWCSEMSTDPSDRTGYVKIDLTDIATPYDIIINSRSNAGIGYSFNQITDEKIYFAEKDVVDETEGWRPMKDEDGNPIYASLPNGEYEITITDADGSIMVSTFSMGAKKLSFTTEVVDFVTPNNFKASEYENVPNIINHALNRFGYDETIQKFTSEIGGVIVLTNVVDRATDGEGDYILTVKPRVSLDGKIPFEDFLGSSIKFTIKADGSWDVGNGKPNSNYFINGTYKLNSAGNDLPFIACGVPYGDWEYIVTVTQLCDDVESANSSSISVKVQDPVPYKLLINGIDIDIFNPVRFNTGWDINRTDTRSATASANNVKGWDSLAATAPEWNDLYIWKNLTEYQKLLDELGLPSDIDENVADTYDEIVSFKETYIEQIKSVFWMTCPSGSKDIVIRLNTQQYPILIQLVYHEEELEGNVTDLHVLTSPDQLTASGGGYSVSDIGIPTIANHYDETYGDLDGKNENTTYQRNDAKGYICFGYDRVNDWYKRPYFVAAYNGKEEPLPKGLTKNNIDTPDILNKFFSFHIIDKILRLPFVAWSYFNAIPYFFGKVAEENDPVNADKLGNTVTMNGLLASYIYNGIVEDAVAGGLTFFEEQSLGSKDLTIITFDGNENRIPTRRFIRYNETETQTDGSIKPKDPEYPNYYIKDMAPQIEPHYQPVLNRNDSLTLSDSSCTYEETIYGKMSVRLGSQSMNDYRNNSDHPNTLQVSTNNGDTQGTTRYFIINVYDHNGIGAKPYPLNHVDNGIFVGNGYNEYRIMEYEASLNKLICDDTTVQGQYIDTGIHVTEKDENDAEITRIGYSLDGLFKNLDEGCYYIAAVTENNCRALSPVYDFRPLTVELRILDEGGNYQIGVMVLRELVEGNNPSGENRYYIKYFDFNTNIVITLGESPINVSAQMHVADNLPLDGTGIPEANRDPSEMYSDKIVGPTGETNYEVSMFVIGWKGPVITGPTDIQEIQTFTDTDVHYLVNKDKNGEILSIMRIKPNTAISAPETVWVVEDTDLTELPVGATEIDMNANPSVTLLIDYTPPIPAIPPATTPTPAYYTYATYDSTGTSGGWIVVETTDSDPTMPHYAKWADSPITKKQYDSLKSLIGMALGLGKVMIKNATTVTITDVTGLPHICKISDIIVSNPSTP